MEATFYRTYHALRRQSQRNLSDEDVWFVFEHGRRLHCAGALHIFLGRRDIPSDKATYQRFGRLEGTVLVLDDTRDALTLITTYRNRQGFKQIRVKTKYDKYTNYA
jgi:hypothetical protein